MCYIVLCVAYSYVYVDDTYGNACVVYVSNLVYMVNTCVDRLLQGRCYKNDEMTAIDVSNGAANYKLLNKFNSGECPPTKLLLVDPRDISFDRFYLKYFPTLL